MAKVNQTTVDFIRAQPHRALEDGREATLAENVLLSYTRAIDLLAEALQNATDAIDDRYADEPDAPRRIRIDFDRRRRSISVTDTGTGMPYEELEVVLAPNVTFKSGRHDKHPHRRSRGEKGVGLSFLVFACNRFEIDTSDGTTRFHARVDDAYSWVDSEGSATRPVAVIDHYDDIRKTLDSERFTRVTLSAISEEIFDDDIFELDDAALIWLLRTQTAVGNTSTIFEPLGRSAPAPIKVELHTVEKDGTKRETPHAVPYRYALPEELLPKGTAVDFEDLDPDPRAQQAQLRGRALRYLQRVERSDGRYVDVYFFVVDGRQMKQVLDKRAARGRHAPEDWTGLWLATRGMPATVELTKPGLITPAAYARRTFALLQWDDLKLDLGRKTVAGRTRQMLHDVVEQEWAEIADAAARVQVAPESGRGEAIVKARVAGARRLPDIAGPVPYLKVPQSRDGVAALFHELIAVRDSPVHMYTLRTGVIGDEDELVYPAVPNGQPPLHVIYGLDLKNVLDQLRSDERLAETAGLAVLWTVGDAGDVEIVETPKGPGTHEARLYTSIDRLPLLVLESLIARMGERADRRG